MTTVIDKEYAVTSDSGELRLIHRTTDELNLYDFKVECDYIMEYDRDIDEYVDLDFLACYCCYIGVPKEVVTKAKLLGVKFTKLPL